MLDQRNRRHRPAHRPRPARTSSPATLEAEQDLVVDGRHFKAQCVGQGPSVLLVSGFGATMGEWGDLPTRLGATARTCMYDRLGVGGSDSPPPVQTFQDIAADLDGVISALRLPRPVVLVASDLGGPIAVTWAAQHQPDGRALVLLDPVPPGWQAAAPSLLPPPDPGDPELTAMFESDRRDNDPKTNLERLDPRSWAAYDRINGLDVPLWVLVARAAPTAARGRRRRQVRRGLEGRAASAGRRVQRQPPGHRGRLRLHHLAVARRSGGVDGGRGTDLLRWRLGVALPIRGLRNGTHPCQKRLDRLGGLLFAGSFIGSRPGDSGHVRGRGPVVSQLRQV